MHFAWRNIWVSNFLLAVEACGSLCLEEGKGRRGAAHTQSLELLGSGKEGAAFQRGMMEVFVIERRDEMRRAGTDGATDEGQTGADRATGAGEESECVCV